jgi:3-oxoadipate enol-lactonase
MSSIIVEGVPFNVRIDGTPDAPWVVMAHGLATNLTLWDDLVEAIKDDYLCLRYDARGHGATPAMPGDYSFDLLVRDAIGLMDAMHIGKAHFVGLSMGGMVALGLAIGHPDRIASIAVCDARAQADEEYVEGWNHRIKIVSEGGMDALVERTLARWFTPAFLARPSAALDKMRRMMAGTPRDGYCGCAAALKSLNYGGELNRIVAPTLLLVGAQDLGAPVEIVQGMQRSIRGARYVEIPEAGHISNIEQPTLFSAAVSGFLREVERDRANV